MATNFENKFPYLTKYNKREKKLLDKVLDSNDYARLTKLTESIQSINEILEGGKRSEHDYSCLDYILEEFIDGILDDYIDGYKE